jgi:hypothetical protein
MAEIRSMEMKRRDVIISLKISKPEYDLLSNNTSNLLLLPATPPFLDNALTTGKLGNSNRIMLPKKILEKFGIRNLEKKVPAKTFSLNDEIFLLIRLQKSMLGIPVFKDHNGEG